jgi:rhodanese-related sulfurtransferase
LSTRTGNRFVLVDVRTPQEFAAGTIPTAINIPVDELRARLGELPRDRELVVFCQAGQRGYLATRILLQAGFTKTGKILNSSSVPGNSGVTNFFQCQSPSSSC